MADPSTARPPADSTLLDALAMFDSLLGATWAGVGFIDRTLRYVRVNQTLLDRFPTPAGELAPLAQRVFETGEAVRGHTLDLPPDGIRAAAHLLLDCFPVRHPEGDVRWAGVAMADITERERAARALRESEERFRLAARAARDVVWDWDLTLDTVTTVGGAARVFGFPEAQVGDSSAWWEEQIHPDDRDRVLASLAAVVADGELWAEEYRHRRAGGEYAVVVDRAYVVRNEAGQAVRMVGVTTDVTLERTAARAVAESEARFRTVFESRMIGIGFWGGGRVWEANDELLRLLGWSREELEAGMIVTERLTPPDQRPRDLVAMRQLETVDAISPYEKEFLRKDGTRLPVLVGGSRFNAPPATGVFFVLDNSELRRVREQAQAAQRMESVGRLAGGVAHEVNNALQGVLGFSDFVLRSLDSGGVSRTDVEQIRRSAERAARVTQQLLAFSRRQLLRPVELDLNEVLGAFVPMLHRALGPGRELVVLRSAAPVLVHADPGQLEQVMLNLALNARDAMPDEGRLTVRIDHVELEEAQLVDVADAPPPGRFGLLEFADTGAGMDDGVRARLFEPFFTTKPLGMGSGLGLAVVHGIVRQSGGLVTCESAPGSGSTFRVHLPISSERAGR